MAKSSLSIAQVLTLLAETPPRLAALPAGLSPAQLQTSSAPDDWSVNEVLAHLRACADVWGNCIATMLAAEHPTLRAIHPSAWIEQTDYRAQAFATSLQAFSRQRAALLATLEPLSPDEWERGATVTGAGAPRERTVLFYAQWMARHERTHVAQLDRLARTMRQAGG